jgi:DNA-binding MarR family transcriptional regulator
VSTVDTGRLSETEYHERLRDLPPSAKLVAKVLEIESPRSQEEVAGDSLLPDRTVRYALDRLEEREIVRTRHDPRDARRRVYSLRR